MDKQKILIYGAGAIGRGFLAPTFSKLGYEIFFVDNNKKLVSELKKRNSYKTAFSNEISYDIVNVDYSNAFLLGEEDEEISKMDFVFSCVGPNNINSFAKKLKNAKTVISFENDSNTVNILSSLSKNPNCYFGIPDVITSNDAPNELKKMDPLCLVSEKGEYAIEKGNFLMPKQIKTYSKKDLEKYWACKFYLHNTPHATAAFLGKLFDNTYLHEAMQNPLIEKAVISVMESTKKAMKIKKMVNDDFIDFYSKKEIERFKDPFLFDPIKRVGREPLRKLRQEDRLIQTLMFISETNQDVDATILTIKAAMYDVFKNSNKEAFEILGEIPNEKLILQNICGIKKNTKLYKKIKESNLFQMLYSKNEQTNKIKIPLFQTIQKIA